MLNGDLSQTKLDGVVAFFIPSFVGGGTQRVIIDLANAASRSGLSVDLVVCKAEGVFMETVAEGVNIVDLCGWRLYSPLIGLCRYLHRNNPVVMYAALNDANVLALLAKRITGVRTKIVMTVHNHLGAKMARKPSPLNPIRRFILGLAYRSCHRVVAVSVDLKRYFVENWSIPDSQIVAIENPIDFQTLRRTESDNLSHPWLLDQGIPVVISVGRLEAQKDYPTLLRAIALTNKVLPLRLIVLGDGSKRASLDALTKALELEDVVDFVGFQSNPAAWISKADIFALSSQWEGSSLVILEAMALGKSIVSTDCECGPRENLETYPLGYLVPVSDAKSMSNALIKIIKNPETLETPFQGVLTHGSNGVLSQYLELVYGD